MAELFLRTPVVKMFYFLHQRVNLLLLALPHRLCAAKKKKKKKKVLRAKTTIGL